MPIDKQLEFRSDTHRMLSETTECTYHILDFDFPVSTTGCHRPHALAFEDELNEIIDVLSTLFPT